MCLWIFFISSQCIWHEAGTEVAAAATTTTANRKPFSAACFRLRASVCAHSVTISSFTKEELLFASKSAYFEISVCIYKKKRRKKLLQKFGVLLFLCARAFVSISFAHNSQSASLSLLLHFVHTVKNEKKVFLLPPCGCIAFHVCGKWRRRLHF